MMVFEFGAPWLLSLMTVPLVYGLVVWRCRMRLQSNTPKLLLPSMVLLENRLDREPRIPGAIRLRVVMRASALVAVVLSVCDVYQVGEFEPPRQQGRPIMFVIDSSLTMSLEDMGASSGLSRMEATQQVLHKWMETRPQNAYGLVVFGSSASVLSRPTADTAFAMAQLRRVQVGTLGDNTALGDAMALAIRELEQSRTEANLVPSIVLISDGEDSNSGSMSPLESAAIAMARGYPIHSLQFGRPTRLPELQPSLAEVSALTGGRHWVVQSVEQLESIVNTLDGITPLVQMPPLQSKGFWWSPWLALIGVLLALLSLMVGRSRSHGIVDPKLRAWAIRAPSQGPLERLREPLLTALGTAVTLLVVALLWSNHTATDSASSQGTPTRIVAVVDLLGADTSRVEVQRLSVLGLAGQYPRAAVAVVAAGPSSGLVLPFTHDRAALTRVLDQLVAHREALIAGPGGSEESPDQQRNAAIGNAQAYLDRHTNAQEKGAVVVASNSRHVNQLMQAGPTASEKQSHARAFTPLNTWQVMLLAALVVLLLGWLPLGGLSWSAPVARAASGVTVLAVVSMLFVALPSGSKAASLSPPMSLARESTSASDPFASGFERHFSEGLDRLQKAQNQAAVESFSNSLALGVVSGQRAALFNLGLSLSHQGAFSQALSLWNAYLEKYPDDAEARGNLDFVQKRLAAMQAAKGRQTDLKGRRGQAALGEIQTDGSGSDPNDLDSPSRPSEQGPRAAGNRLLDSQAATASGGRGVTLRAWPIGPETASSAQYKMDRIQDESASLLKGLIRQSYWADLPATASDTTR